MRRLVSVLALIGAAAATATMAQPAEERALTGKPVWLRMPSGQDISDMRPAKVVAEPRPGGVMLDCRATAEGMLADCRVITEAPRGYDFGAAALRLSALYQMGPTTEAGEAVAGARVRVPVTFNSMRTGGTMSLMAHPIWVRAPSQADLTAAYPTAGGGVAGEAVLTCAFDVEGRPADCAVKSEAPQGRGFGAAALSLADGFEVVHTADDAEVLPSVSVDIPFVFRRPDAGIGRAPGAPEWLVSLTPAAAEQVFPPAALEAGTLAGMGRVDCAVTRTGRLDDCRVEQERPQGLGFGAAAIQASTLLAMNAWSDKGAPFAGHRVSVPIRLELKAPALIGEPVWIRQPSPRDMADLRPRGQGRAKMSGGATLNCIVKATGYLGGCAIQDEAPKGYDFGAAVLELAPLFRMAPKARNGQATAGTRVLVELSFEGEAQ